MRLDFQAECLGACFETSIPQNLPCCLLIKEQSAGCFPATEPSTLAEHAHIPELGYDIVGRELAWYSAPG